ncbi:hypothetical protein ACFVP3_33375 [Streptomyces sp. NPDC057806]|uniref:hypothetical protein n=1 Tax=unclassified Streptomyces TaxID=2593676 RepID=UPI0036B193F8
MERIRDFLTRHLWVQIALSVLAASVLVALLYPGRSFATVVLRTAIMSAGGICIMVIMRRKEKRAAGGKTNDLLSLDQKLRKGEVPQDPREQSAMRDLVAQRLHRTRHRVAALIFLAVLFTTVTVGTALTAGPRQTIGMTVLSVGFIAWMIYFSNLQNRRLHTMRAALEERVPSVTMSGAPSHRASE